MSEQQKMTESELVAKLRFMFEYVLRPCPFKPGDLVRTVRDTQGNALQPNCSTGIAIVLRVKPGHVEHFNHRPCDVEALYFNDEDNTFSVEEYAGWQFELVEGAGESSNEASSAN